MQKSAPLDTGTPAGTVVSLKIGIHTWKRDCMIKYIIWNLHWASHYDYRQDHLNMSYLVNVKYEIAIYTNSPFRINGWLFGYLDRLTNFTNIVRLNSLRVC